jgi:hypothetical protein
MMMMMMMMMMMILFYGKYQAGAKVIIRHFDRM